ncbi:hypothetical protein SDC9_100434 [bioreactor metagenome]|uniref:Response regulatory domain-containing protein n=1 Tax=bioreactor metagenome TaxID=1076179 RepID=A0A645AKC4_9ZZZZ
MITDVNTEGLAFAKESRSKNPDSIILFIADSDDYLSEALRLRADYYMLKPFSADDVRFVLKRMKLLHKGSRKRIFFRTFGNFDVFIDGKPVPFSSAKAKELLALLVDRKGGILTSEEAFSYLWEDKQYDSSSQSLYRKVIQRLKENLKSSGIEDILLRTKDGRCLDRDMFDCDYYRFLNGDADAVKSFTGEYMTNYSWGEFTLAGLISIAEKQKSADN